jgi:F-type H+-transporting ATPase subunit b
MTVTGTLVPAGPDAPRAEEHPLIDIDNTVWVQLVLFMLVALIGSRLLFRPYLKMRDKRAAGIEGARAEASQMTAEAGARVADYEQKLTVARNRALEERRTIRTQAAERQRELTEAARAESTAALDQAKARIASETATARGALRPHATQVADDMAAKLLGRKVRA